MPVKRPSHLKVRQIRFTFPKDAVLIREGTGSRDRTGKYIPGVTTETPLKVSTAPVVPGSAKGESTDSLREGLRLTGSRTFWISTEYPADGENPIPVATGNNPSGPDKIRYNGKVYKIDNVEQWDGFAQCLGILEDSLIEDAQQEPTTERLEDARRGAISIDSTLTGLEASRGTFSTSNTLTMPPWEAGETQHRFVGVPENDRDITDLQQGGVSIFTGWHRYNNANGNAIIVGGHKWWTDGRPVEGQFNSQQTFTITQARE